MRIARLVKQAKKGDKEALLQLINEQQDDYYRLALSYMGNSHDAMDAMEEMIVSLYRHIPKLKKNKSFYSWSKTILVNQCRQMLRKADRVVLLENFESDEFHSEDALLDGVAVQIENDEIPLTTTIRQDYVTGKNGKEYKERILLFDSTQLPVSITINGIHYEKKYGETVEIPVRK